MKQEFWSRGGYSISTDKNKLDIPSIYKFLSTTYWANNRTIETVKKSIENTLSFGVYESDKQIGFARVLSDYSTISYIFDFYILPSHQKLGLGTWLIETIVNYHLIRSSNIALATKDKHAFYEKAGFDRHQHPERIMVLIRE